MPDDLQLTTHFKLSEFRCRCCGLVDPVTAATMAEFLEDIRVDTGPLVIVSGQRCPSHNTACGGKPHSWHLLGLAVDIFVANDAARYRLVQSLISNGCKGIGIGKSDIHADRGTRVLPVLWTYYA